MGRMNLDDLDRSLRELAVAIPAGDPAYLLQVLRSDAETRAEAIGALYATALAPATLELLIDAEEDPAVRAVLVGLFREVQSGTN